MNITCFPNVMVTLCYSLTENVCKFSIFLFFHIIKITIDYTFRCCGFNVMSTLDWLEVSVHYRFKTIDLIFFTAFAFLIFWFTCVYNDFILIQYIVKLLFRLVLQYYNEVILNT